MHTTTYTYGTNNGHLKPPNDIKSNKKYISLISLAFPSRSTRKIRNRHHQTKNRRTKATHTQLLNDL